MSLKDQRLAAGLTIQELAKKSGVHHVKISQFEAGKLKTENMTLRNAVKLSEALGCAPKDLM